jgi:hypothetical protein
MNLENAAAEVRQQFPGGHTAAIERAEQRLERFGRIAFGGLGLVMAVAIAGIVYAIIKNFIIDGDQPIAGIILALFVIFAALTLAWVVMNEDLKDKRKKRGIHIEMEVPLTVKPVTNKHLTQPAEAEFSSVTEDTTDLLTVENRTRKLEN